MRAAPLLSLSLLLIIAVCRAATTRNKEPRENVKELPTECGETVTIPSLESIYDGEGVRLGELPWVAKVGWTDSFGEIHYGCSGTLISDRYVSTSAACAHKISGPGLGKVRLGSVKRDSKGDDDLLLREYEVEKSIVHSQWKNLTNDIALLKLKLKVIFNDATRPICLPAAGDEDKSLEGELAVAASWGVTVNGSRSSTLQKVELPVIGLAQCKSNLTSDDDSEALIDQRVVCAGGGKGKDTCYGDAGGPLMLRPNQTSGGKWTMIGVTSWGIACGTEGYPGVYTRVSSFRDWILDHIDS